MVQWSSNRALPSMLKERSAFPLPFLLINGFKLPLMGGRRHVVKWRHFHDLKTLKALPGKFRDIHKSVQPPKPNFCVRACGLAGLPVLCLEDSLFCRTRCDSFSSAFSFHFLLPVTACPNPRLCSCIDDFVTHFCFLFSRHLVEITISSRTSWRRALIIFAARVTPRGAPPSTCSPTGTPSWVRCVCPWWTGLLASSRTSMWPHGNSHSQSATLGALLEFSLHVRGGSGLVGDRNAQRMGNPGQSVLSAPGLCCWSLLPR